MLCWGGSSRKRRCCAVVGCRRRGSAVLGWVVEEELGGGGHTILDPRGEYRRTRTCRGVDTGPGPGVSEIWFPVWCPHWTPGGSTSGLDTGSVGEWSTSRSLLAARTPRVCLLMENPSLAGRRPAPSLSADADAAFPLLPLPSLCCPRCFRLAVLAVFALLSCLAVLPCCPLLSPRCSSRLTADQTPYTIHSLISLLTPLFDTHSWNRSLSFLTRLTPLESLTISIHTPVQSLHSLRVSTLHT